ncbi:hypothetical protein SAMN05216297_1126 [Flavobacterium phragmitis]|uniref:Uncharacterized protein n=1 Tax=Flavobacterium phragmitis TaxID=739143 RepID=A0A1I1V6Z2_9FLAO|nr:hypothetical protein SAMN05216297_1126 [Flavobacterium phragmitis]
MLYRTIVQPKKDIKSGNFVTIYDLDKKPARYFFYTFENFHIIFKNYLCNSIKK